MNLEDTIAAMATPSGEGSIGIVRISGRKSIEIAKKVFMPIRPLSEFESHRLYYGKVVDPSNNHVIDECLLAVMKAPRSYTGEDVVELQCHGSMLILQRVLEVILKMGARAAGPGEFTKRAFLNSRMDLIQAESVIELIRAKTCLALDAARNQFSGRLSEKINTIKEGIIDVLCRIEAGLDFPEEEDVKGVLNNEIEKRLGESVSLIEELLSTYDEGRVLREGLKVIIAGWTNVGKSSLLNMLLKEERAIVTPIPGTTRDVIEEVLNIKGIPVRLIDTAGLRETKDEVEEIGIRFAMERLKDADLVLFVVDGSKDDVPRDVELFKKIGDYKKRAIIILNKMDIAVDAVVEKIINAFKGYSIVKISALLGHGIDEIRDAIYLSVLGGGNLQHDIILTNARHKTAIERAQDCIKSAQSAACRGFSGEFLAMDLKCAINSLGEVVGETLAEDILERIFSQFCIGK